MPDNTPIARSIPRMPTEKKAAMTAQIHMMLTPEQDLALDDFQFANRIRTRSEALRAVLVAGLEALALMPAKAA